jgi:hypothetical protein
LELLELKGNDLRRELVEAESRRHADGLRGSIPSIATPATKAGSASTQERNLRNIQNERFITRLE